MTKPKVAFICVHNSCRSQIAEALGKALASDVFESYSAGTETKPQINQDAVRLIKALYGIDMEQTQYSNRILPYLWAAMWDVPSSADLLMITGNWKTQQEKATRSLRRLLTRFECESWS